ncbi:MAG: FIG00387823: hypothetical protein [uncultured Sulfurovum sp.]|uniref:Uncharacterized protein n=1 Tax=uncultured Sulfurovum sp. TaxID=269237 RepID=A0A6S6TMK7_9BACT|nr:MAG: FIG00387823: hypothetical protein [uncultured Sulfurovum sp.]
MRKFFLLLLFLMAIAILYFYLTKVNTDYAFYHWKQNYKNTEMTEPKYIKVMDIGYESKSKIHLTKFKVKPRHKIVPVIYIDNPIFKHENAKKFAKKLFLLLEEQAKNTFYYHEVQIDCDWTDSTKEAYFLFLKTFKVLSKKQLSTTIRLHQIKYHKRTGVPPVDKGVLMYYNMSNFKDLETKNYILDLKLAQQYHHNFDTYPLKLDLALPLYAQATVIRFEEVVSIIEGVRKEDLNTHFKALKQNHYQITKTHYLKKRLLYKDDILRIDEVSIDELKQAIKNLKEVMKQPEEIIFYRWGNKKFYGEENLKKVTNW